ncbi:MAG: TraB/GumN family protein [Gammaproteobacteria bacterium]|nr:TraB/GumN family protein [Gammaproteobacteria bacterium]MDH5617283.1 TraB/GumN family protein [Gammaproteobacteria bacterium]
MMRWPCLLLCVVCASASADDRAHPVTLWRVAGETNSVYLLGSVHLLREHDHPLPGVIDNAYRDAEVVVMELDMDDMDPLRAQAAFNRAGVMTDGRTLRDLLGEEAFATASEAAAIIDIPLDMLEQSKPWLAAMTVELLMLYRIGFNPMLGVEMTMTRRAAADGKPIEGLETVDEQLSFLDGLPIEAQRKMLLQTLAEGAALSESIDELIDAWHRGDTAALEEALLTATVGQEELREVLISSRNRRWAETVAAWLDDEQDYLVVVGALHLVGPEGVPALLEKRGFGIHQLSEPATVR